jgi:anti-sigma regulatory factor (Ser/Thr protein kinase)
MASRKAPTARTSRWSYETTLAAEPASASRARAFVARHLSEHRLPHLIDPVRLIASELATNALVHAQTRFTITLSELDDIVLLSVRDGSPELAPRAGPDTSDTTGRGLKIVALLSLDWGVGTDPDGTKTVWASFSRRHAQRP